MAKQGQHHNDINDESISTSRNNPSKSQVITTGTYKKRATYKKQAALHQDPGKRAQAAKPIAHPDARELLTHEANSQERALDRTTRSGSDSDASSGTRGH